MRVIIKIGSSSLLEECKIDKLMEVISKASVDNELILVTSGAILFGMKKLGLINRPIDMNVKQACAAIGQVKLIEEYEKAANKYNILIAQILLNHDDFDSRKRLLNFKNTLNKLLSLKVIPIINENDALAVEEIKLGDNDTLAALLVPVVDASLVILFSDIDGLYDKDPNKYSNALLINKVEEINKDIEQMAGCSSVFGTGGMYTKIRAAKISTCAKCDLVIANSNEIDNLINIIKGDKIGTIFKATKTKTNNKLHWLIYSANSKGIIKVDEGAKYALLNRKSLLSKGIISVTGDFVTGSVVDIYFNTKLGKGIVNYSSDEIKLILGKNSSEISKILGYKDKDEVIHANDIVLEGSK